MTIKVICSWCGRVLGSKQDSGAPCSGIGVLVSHSICAECMEKALSDISSVSDSVINPGS